MVGPGHCTRPRDSHLQECAERKKVDPPIHTGYLYTGGATNLDLIVDGDNTVNSSVMRSTILWNMVVPPSNMTYKFSRMSASHFVEVSWTPLALMPMTFWLEQYIDVTETFGTDSGMFPSESM